MIIMQMVKIFSLSVSAATLPNPTLVIQVIVKYRAVTYMVFLEGPFINSNVLDSFVQMYEYGVCVTLASFHNQEYCKPLSVSERPMEYQMQASQ
uniref:Putative secreted protein n=1 Tax=Panstrongylus lignarius TaxID=156445 RepID=A0A224Y3K0_9HEMI